MTIAARKLAEGSGWRVTEVTCQAGPDARPDEEWHDVVCIAPVRAGWFCYRTSQGTALMTPGSLLLGNANSAFECSHEHGSGDCCVSFHFTAEYWERAIGATDPVKPFQSPKTAPSTSLTGLLADIEVASADSDAASWEELGLRLAVAALTTEDSRLPQLTARDHKRTTQALRLIEEEGGEPIGLAGLASAAATSPFHFLRTFRAVTGMTPHQYRLRTRLHRAAVRLRSTDDAVSAIAFDSGFGDLSSFNNRFRKVVGMTPTAYRASRQSDRNRIGERGWTSSHTAAKV